MDSLPNFPLSYHAPKQQDCLIFLKWTAVDLSMHVNGLDVTHKARGAVFALVLPRPMCLACPTWLIVVTLDPLAFCRGYGSHCVL